MSKKLRREEKYIVSYLEFISIKDNILCFMKYDDNCSQGGYDVMSLYFDSIFDDSAITALDGNEFKYKVRLRFYNGNIDKIKLEVKCKRNDTGYKLSLIISKEEAEKMISGDFSFLIDRGTSVAITIYTILLENAFRPKTIVKYNRIAFTYPASNIRVTFDTNIYSSLNVGDFLESNKFYYPIFDLDKGILEVKYDKFLTENIKYVLEPLEKSKIAYSKYLFSRLAI